MRKETVSRCLIENDLTSVVKIVTDIYNAETRCLSRITKECREAWINDREPNIDNCELGLVYSFLSDLLDILTGEHDYILNHYEEIR